MFGRLFRRKQTEELQRAFLQIAALETRLAFLEIAQRELASRPYVNLNVYPFAAPSQQEQPQVLSTAPPQEPPQTASTEQPPKSRTVDEILDGRIDEWFEGLMGKIGLIEKRDTSPQ